MRLSSLLVAASVGSLAAASAASAQTYNLVPTSTGTFDANGSSGLSASQSGGTVTLTNGGNGEGLAYAIYQLPTPVAIGSISGLTYSARVLSSSNDYTASPIFVIDADNTGGINAGTNPPSFFYGKNPSDLGVGGGNAGDAIIASDVNIDADAIDSPDSVFVNYTLIGSNPEIEGFYGSNVNRDAFGTYYGSYEQMQANLADYGVEPTDLVHQIYFAVGGSGSYANHSVEFRDVTLTVTPVPEPAALSLLAVGGLAVLRRRRA